MQETEVQTRKQPSVQFRADLMLVLVTEGSPYPADNLVTGPLEEGFAPARSARHIIHSCRCLLCRGLVATARAATGPLLHLRQLNGCFPGSGWEWNDRLRQRRRRGPTTAEPTLSHICLSRVDIGTSCSPPGPGFDASLISFPILQSESWALSSLCKILFSSVFFFFFFSYHNVGSCDCSHARATPDTGHQVELQGLSTCTPQHNAGTQTHMPRAGL